MAVDVRAPAAMLDALRRARAAGGCGRAALDEELDDSFNKLHSKLLLLPYATPYAAAASNASLYRVRGGGKPNTDTSLD